MRPHLATKELGPDKFEIVIPSISILAEPPVTVVDKNVDKKGTRKVAEAYLEYLYSPEGQEIAGKHFYRPRDAKAAEKYEAQFSPVKLFTIDEVFGGWAEGAEDPLRGRRDLRPDLRSRRRQREEELIGRETTTIGKNLDQLRTHAAG